MSWRGGLWRVDVLSIVSGMAVDLLMDALTEIFGVLTNIDIGVNVLVDVNVNVFAGVMTGFEFVMPGPWEKFRCWAAFGFRPIAVLDCWMPSYHVWSRLTLPALPQFPNQEPLRPQQLISPDFAMIPHLAHTELMAVVVAAGVYTWALVNNTKMKTRKQLLIGVREDYPNLLR